MRLLHGINWFNRRFGTTPEQTLDDRVKEFVKKLAILGVSGIGDRLFKELGVEPQAQNAHARVLRALERGGFTDQAAAIRQQNPTDGILFQSIHGVTEGSRALLNHAKKAVVLAVPEIVGPAVGRIAQVVGLNLPPQVQKQIGKLSELADFVPDDIIGMATGLAIKETSKLATGAIDLIGAGKKTAEFVVAFPGKVIDTVASVANKGSNIVNSLPEKTYAALDYVLGLSELEKIINDFPGWPWEQKSEPIIPTKLTTMKPMQSAPVQSLVAEAVPVAA